MAKRTVRDVDWAGKRAFVRVDFNVPFDAAGVEAGDAAGAISDDSRIREALPTLAHLREGGASVVLGTHRGRPGGVRADSPIVIAYTGDEEKSGKHLSSSRKHLVDAGKWADIALGFESAIRYDGVDWATIARRSSTGWILRVTGKQAHSSGIFSDDDGAGAIFETARILNAFYDEVRGEEHLTFNAGTIQGGTDVDYDPQQNRGTTFGKTNVIPRKTVVHGGIRTISQDQLDRARTAMQAIVANNSPHTSASIEFFEGYPPMFPTAAHRDPKNELSATPCVCELRK